MPFDWNPTPNPPTPIVPIPVPPGEVTYEVKLVANTVDYGGTVRYNTANHSYDVVYEFPTLNVTNGVFENGFFESANIGNAHINVATINHASINTANITNATITFGYVTGSPNANMGIASKFYVDNAIAAISGGTGPDSTANLFISTGDLLAGISPNTAQRLGVGTGGQVLTVNVSSSVRQTWKDAASSQRATGVLIGTHHHPSKKLSQVLLKHADGIIMNDGEYVGGWDNLVADIATTGAGGLDANSVEAPSTWYEVLAIRNSTTGAKALLLHRMLDRIQDAKWLASTRTLVYLRRGDTLLTIPDMRYCTKISQSFVPTRTGKIASIDAQIQKILTPTGNLWISIQGDNGLGNADGEVLCTSERTLVQSLSTGTTIQIRFVFDTAVTLGSGQRYHMVAEGDFGNALADTGNSIAFEGNTAPLGPGQQSWMANVGYTSGNLTLGSGYGDCRIWNVVTSTWKVSANAVGVGQGPQDLYFSVNMEENSTALVLPTGYNQYALLSYVRNDSSSNFNEYHQQNRTLSMGYEPAWQVYSEAGLPQGVVLLDVSAGCPPVPLAVRLLAVSFNFLQGGLLPVASRVAFDVTQSTVSSDVTARGHFGRWTSSPRLGLINTMAIDGWNYGYTYSFGGTSPAFLYISSFTF